MILLVEAQLERNFKIKRGGQEPFQLIRFNQLLAMAQQNKSSDMNTDQFFKRLKTTNFVTFSQ